MEALFFCWEPRNTQRSMCACMVAAVASESIKFLPLSCRPSFRRSRKASKQSESPFFTVWSDRLIVLAFGMMVIEEHS